MMVFNKKIRGIPVFPVSLMALFYIWQTWLVKGNCFFWDTVQFGSLHSNWYYENHFRHFLLPDIWDSGHPPVFGMYIALCWTFFGKSLAVSHYAMLPWLLIALWQMTLLVKKLTKDKHLQAAALMLLIVNPVWSSQATLVSPDIILGACFLGIINGIIYKKSWLVLIFGIGISLISNRGLMISFSLFLTSYLSYNGLKIKWKSLIYTVLPFLGGWALAISYMLYHYFQKGWIGYYEGSSWNESFIRVDASGLLKNVLVYGWRLADFGHIGLWLILVFILFKNRKRLQRYEDFEFRFFFILGICLLFLFALLVLPYQGLLGHRYFLPIYWVLSIFALLALLRFVHHTYSKKWIYIAIISLISGNFWIYPQPIATGWDSTLAHLSYYQVRKKMISYMKENEISFAQTGTAFPNQLSSAYIDLQPGKYDFVEKNLETNEYVFYSNIMNDFSPAELVELKIKWKEVKTMNTRKRRMLMTKL